MKIDLKKYDKVFKTEDIPNELIQGTISKKYLL